LSSCCRFVSKLYYRTAVDAVYWALAQKSIAFVLIVNSTKEIKLLGN
jgi:hypothetical protein